MRSSPMRGRRDKLKYRRGENLYIQNRFALGVRTIRRSADAFSCQRAQNDRVVFRRNNGEEGHRERMMSLNSTGKIITCDGERCTATTLVPVALRSTLTPAAPPSTMGWLFVQGAAGTQHFCPACAPDFLNGSREPSLEPTRQGGRIRMDRATLRE